MEITIDNISYISFLASILFYKNMQFMRDEREKNSKIELPHTPMLENETPEQWSKRVSEEFPIKLNQLRKEQAEATINFLKEHIISKERFYQLIEEYHNDNNTVSILQEDYKQRSLHTGKELEKILAETREIREKGFLRHDYIEKTLEKQPYLNEYAELVNHQDNLFILELATGGGIGLYPVLKTLQPNSKVICADRELTSIKIADAIADNMGLSDRVFGCKASFWELPFKDETFDVVCMHFGLNSSMEVTRTIQEISRVLKPEGRFVCLSNADNYKDEKLFFNFLDIPESEYRSLYRKSRLYSGLEDLVELSKEHNLSLSQHKKTFDAAVGDTSYQRQVILSVFTKSAVKK